MIRRIFILSAFALSMAWSPACVSQQQGTFEDLTLELQCSTPQLYPFEPIPLRLTIANRTSRPIFASVPLIEGSGHLAFYLYESNEGFVPISPRHWNLVHLFASPRELEPGFSLSLDGYLWVIRSKKDWGYLNWFVLSKPGTAKIKAVLRSFDDHERRIESNELNLTAVKPTGVDVSPYEYLAGLPVPFFLFNDTLPGSPRFRDQFVTKFPTSRYAAYAFYRSGTHLVRQSEPSERNRGLQYLEKASTFDSCFVAPISLNILVTEYYKRNNLDDARRAFSVLMEKYPDSEEAMGVYHLVKILGLNPR